MQKRLPTRTPSSANARASGDSAAGARVSSNGIAAPHAARWARNASADLSEAMRGKEDIAEALHLQHDTGRYGIATMAPLFIASLAAMVQLAEWDAFSGPQLSGVSARIADANALIS